MKTPSNTNGCPNCGFSNFPSNAKFCPKCGLKLSLTSRKVKHYRKCQCGVNFDTIKLKWCPYCGNPLPKLF